MRKNQMAKFEKIFWATIAGVAGIAIVLYFIQYSQPKPELKPTIIDFNQIFKDNSEAINDGLEIAIADTNYKINQAADDLINAKSVDAFLDFHYSVYGEYAEIIAMLAGDIDKLIKQKIFGDDFEQDRRKALNKINKQFKLSAKNQTKFISDIALKDIDKQLFGSSELRKLKRDIRFNQNIKIGKAISSSTGVAGAITAKANGKIVKSIVRKLTIKIGSKPVTKKVLAVISSIGILCGPAAPACVSGLISLLWFATDYATIKLDEHLHREEFKQEIIALINDSKNSFIEQYRENYAAALQDFSQTTRKIYINSDLKVIDRIIQSQ